MRIALLLLLCLAPLAHAGNQLVLGKTLIVKAGSTPEKRKVVVTGKSEGSNSIVGNPTATGGLALIKLTGATSSEQTFTLPTGTSAAGKPFWSGDATKGFKYSDPKSENGPIQRAQIKVKKGAFIFKMSLSSKVAPLTLVPPNPGTSGCGRITIQAGDVYHVAFNDGVVTNKGASLFKISKPTTEGFCLTTTTTTTITTTTTTTTTSTTTTTAAPTCGCNGNNNARSSDGGCACNSNNDCCSNVCGGGGTLCTAPASVPSGGAGCCAPTTCPPGNQGARTLPGGCLCGTGNDCISGVCTFSICTH